MKRNARYGKLSCGYGKITVVPVVPENRFGQVLVVNTGKYDTMNNSISLHKREENNICHQWEEEARWAVDF